MDFESEVNNTVNFPRIDWELTSHDTVEIRKLKTKESVR